MRIRYADDLLTRRDWLRRAGGGMGLLGLAALMADEGLLVSPARARLTKGPSDPMMPRALYVFPARAKNVIWMFINSGLDHRLTRGRHKLKLDEPGRRGKTLDGMDPQTGFSTPARWGR